MKHKFAMNSEEGINFPALGCMRRFVSEQKYLGFYFTDILKVLSSTVLGDQIASLESIQRLKGIV